ncbi:MAG: hypothetical protein ACK4P3_02425 [Fimbriimonadaceae bacterium]
MWEIADRGDPQAITEFGERFPHFSEELIERVETVKHLRTSGKKARDLGRTPELPSSIMVQAIPKWPVYAALGAGAVLIVATAIFLTQWLNKQDQFAQMSPTPSPPTMERFQQPSGSQPPATAPAEHQPDPGIGVPPIQSPAASNAPLSLERRITVRFQQASLEEVLTIVLSEAGMRPVLAERLPDTRITASFESTPVRSILEALTAEVGIGYIDQRDGTMLIVPPGATGASDPPTPRVIPPPRTLPDIR